jgi:hypothetical protein
MSGRIVEPAGGCMMVGGMVGGGAKEAFRCSGRVRCINWPARRAAHHQQTYWNNKTVSFFTSPPTHITGQFTTTRPAYYLASPPHHHHNRGHRGSLAGPQEAFILFLCSFISSSVDLLIFLFL